MKDDECISFLQWVLPQMQMQWAGFRKIRTRVCKRLQRHLHELHLDKITAYQTYLNDHPEEWRKLDEICQVTISRFYRDKLVFACLAETVLPVLCQQAEQQGRRELKIWSAGCASGEEPFTLVLLWAYSLKQAFPQLALHILATDTKNELLKRARIACYPFSSVKNLPIAWRETAFTRVRDEYCLQPGYQHDVIFQIHDIRQMAPDRDFDLILCRNLAFTYYDQALQIRIAQQLCDALRPGGALLLGVHEHLPVTGPGMELWLKRCSIYRKHQKSGSS